jgi:hypothetical protein
MILNNQTVFTNNLVIFCVIISNKNSEKNMKYIVLFIAYLFCTSTFAGSIKETAVPAKVKNYVMSHYPKAQSIDWDFEDDDNLYEAKFKIDKLKYKLQITPDGRLHASKEDVLISTLPKPIPQYIREHYAGYKILGANKKVFGNKVTYDVGIKGKNAQGNTRHYNVYFDSKGNKISRK